MREVQDRMHNANRSQNPAAPAGGDASDPRCRALVVAIIVHAALLLASALAASGVFAVSSSLLLAALAVSGLSLAHVVSCIPVLARGPAAGFADAVDPPPQTHEDYLARVAPSMPGTVCSVHRDPDGRLRMSYMSRDLTPLFGLPPASLETDLASAMSVIAADNVPAILAGFEQSARDQTPLYLEFRTRHPERGAIWVEARGVPETGPDGGTTWHGYVCDITRRKTAEQAIMRDTEWRGLLLDISRDLIGPFKDEAALAHAIFRKVTTPLQLDFGLNYRLANGALQLIASNGLTTESEAALRTLQPGQSICGTVVATGLHQLADADRIAGDELCARARIIGARSLMSFPLLDSKGTVLGVLSLGSTTCPDASPEKAELVGTIANHLSLAWERLEADRTALADRIRMQAAVDIVQLGVFEHDLESGDVRLSARCREIICLPAAGQLQFRDVAATIFEDDRVRVMAAITASWAATGDGHLHTEHRVLKPDGSVRWVCCRAQTQFIGEGPDRKPVRVIGAIADLTERKEAEARQQRLLDELAASEAEANHQRMLFQSVFDSAPEAIVVTDMSCRILRTNPAFEQTFKYSPAELAGLDTRAIYADRSSQEQVGRIAAEYLQAPVMPPQTITFRRKDGTTFSGAISGAVLRGETGGYVGYIGLIRDVTAELAREHALQQTNRLEAIGRLAGGISHDFNNLLTIISGNLQLIGHGLREAPDKPLEPYVREAERAAEMGARLNHRLMTFARQRRLAPVPTDLNKTAAMTIELIRRSFGSTIAIETNFARGLGLVSIDSTELESALLNLAFNARDAMPRGGTLRFSTRNLVVDGGGPVGADVCPSGVCVQIAVEDTGTGMPPEVAARAFEPFFTTKEAGKGSGLGLATVHGFVQQSGGHVGIDSAVGRGTTVTITLPSLEKPFAVPVEAKAVALAAGGTTGQRILVVEDNADVRRITVERLKRIGYRTREAADGPSALNLVEGPQSEGFDLVFTDVMMPGGVSGIDLVRRIRERRPEQRALLTSGFPVEFSQHTWPGGPQLEILRKPYSQLELETFIRRALDQPVG